MSRRPPRPQQPAEAAAAPVSDGDPCPCGLPASYAACCGALHRGTARAADPEQLMRSRFSAFAVRNDAYLLRSWHSTTRPPRIEFDPELRWERLEILATTGGGVFHTEGTVEFRAYCVDRGRAGHLHERSRFVREDGAWVYRDGEATG
ncbi:YchJ family protein [Streptomyces meridianus]|uniref:YchJ family metal-binding protein n=1 Tax=Streptomyces meridianus TaxID=2938945 RepID=A0ABT0XAT5_9ACTN|nr:YchJ family metal-binding protein [Streptomyces meridianus]MCM2579628.1 YchJ family metal-binding protein [Streptomyces meridianus]